MDFTCIVLFLALFYIKPQEWTSLFATIRLVQITLLTSLGTLIFRERSLKARDFFRTPHDFAMAGFFLWVFITYPEGPVAGFREFLNRLTFYVVIVQTLTNWGRITRFLGWWTFFVWVIAFLAIAGEYFWDPLGSQMITNGIMKERLILNLSMTNNPNALGHTIAPLIAMLYFFCIWKRPLFMKQLGYLAYIFPLMAIYLTVSKGAYLVSGITVVATLTFGRPRWVQIALISLAITTGVGAIYALPRMNELQHTKTDEAIQGRIKAFTYGHYYFEHRITGVGFGQFVPTLLRDHGFYKASHSTYVQTGTETGKIGMFLFLMVQWCNLRTLLFSKTRTDEQERIRRLLFVLVLSYMVSGWMVDFAYRATFFMFSAAVAAFHRHLHLSEAMAAEEVEDAREMERPWMKKKTPAAVSPAPEPVPAVAVAEAAPGAKGVFLPAHLERARKPWLRKWETDEAEEAEKPAGPFWSKIGMYDILVGILMVKAVDMIWVWAINNV
jgi:hypothetical protein